MRASLLLVVACLAGCSGPTPEADGAGGTETGAATATSTAKPTPVPAQPAPTTLAGEWRVAGIDGKDFNESYGLALSASEREIWWAPRCAGMVRSYTINGASIRFTSPVASGPAATPGAPSPPVCAIGLPPRLNEVVRALDAATTVARTPSNGIEIIGGGHSVLLFSQ